MKKDTLTEMKKKKKENEREEKIKKELGCKFIRINPDAENYIFVDIGKIQNHIIESTKKSLIDNLSTIKLIKIGTRLETTYCFGCKDFTLNFRPQKVKMTNKGLRKM